MRTYAALPHEYLDEMAALTDEEFGRLARGLLRYSMTGEIIQPQGNEKFYVKRVMCQEDRFRKGYDELTEKRRAAGRKGASARWDGKAILPYGEDGNYNTTQYNTTHPNTYYAPRPYGRRSEVTEEERMRRLVQDMEDLERLTKEGLPK